MITYNNLYLELRRTFLQADCPAAGLEARELVCFGGGKTREEFYRDAPLYVPPETERIIRDLARRHLDGEPVAYLIGEWEFYGLTLHVSEAVLIPRTDTEVLAGEALAYVSDRGPCRVLDLCAGSGCVGLAVAHGAPEAQVVLGELDPGAIRVCRENIRRCGLAGRAAVMRLDVLQPPPRSMGEFACVVSNPPYIPDGDIPGLDRSVRDFEPHLALKGGADGCDFYRAVVRHWRDVLAPGGRLYFEVGVGQADTVRDLMAAGGFTDIRVVPDSQDIPRVVYGTRGDGAAETHAPLCQKGQTMGCEILDLKYRFGDMEQHLFPAVLLGGRDVVLVDCGYPGSLPMLEEALRARGIAPETLTKLVLTHQDDDHMGAAAELKEKYPGLQILASAAEAPYLSGERKNLRLQQGETLQDQLPEDQKAFGEQFCQRYRALRPIAPDVLLQDGDRFDWGGGCEILATPGHTPGHISIRALDRAYMITGDAAVLADRELVIANPEFCLDIEAAQSSLEKVIQSRCRRYICYHGGVSEE